MSAIGTYVIYLIMIFVFLGAIAAIRNSQEGMGKEFIEGLHSIGPIFIPVAGIMAAIPYLSRIIEGVFGPLFTLFGADPAIAATTLIASDMGGYQLAQTLAASKESWLMALVVGFMSGATIIFSIPVGLAMLHKSDHKYLALGVMSGLLSIPIGVFVSCIVMILGQPEVRDIVSSNADSSYQLTLSYETLIINLLPLISFCIALALGLRFIPDTMIRAFLLFGRILYAAITLVLAFSIIEYFTGFFTKLFGAWQFHPIIADAEDQYRALEVAGYIGIMLAGAFPMVYTIRKYLASPMEVIGRRIGLEATGAAGILAASANILAMFRLIGVMRPKDKVLCIAFSVCGAFLFGDHLAFTANFQPTLIASLILGKLTGGISGFLIAYWLSVPKAILLEQQTKISENSSR